MVDVDEIFDLDEERYEFEIFLKNPSAETESFMVTKNTKIEDFLKKYRKVHGCSKNAHLVLSFKGRVLSLDKTFDDYDIYQDDTIHLLVWGC